MKYTGNLPDKDFDINDDILDDAIDSILKRVKVDRKHDIPYVAGYSTDGKTLFIDKDLPEKIKVDGKTVDVDRYLVMHESVEKALIDKYDIHYVLAHQIAERAEKALIEADGIDWDEYDRIMNIEIKEIVKQPNTNIPANLDSRPYKELHQMRLLKRRKK